MITISEEEYRNLKDCEERLTALVEYGVFAWAHYEAALTKYTLKKKKESIIEEIIEDFNEILCTADIEYPAGRDAGHCIRFDKELTKSVIGKYLEELVEVEKEMRNLK